MEDATATEDEDEDELSDELEDNWANSTATGDNWTDYDQDIYMHRCTIILNQLINSISILVIL